MRQTIACLCFALMSFACRGPLVVGSDLDNLPFAGVADDGTPIGRDVEMMESLGRDIEWRRMPFEELLPAVEAGQVDVVCATLGYTPERAERVLFSRPYFTTTIRAVVRNAPGEPTRLGQLAGRRVSGGIGTTSEAAIRHLLPHAIPTPAKKSSPGALERLLTGEVDALVMDGPAARALVSRSGGRLIALEQALDREAYCLAVRPDAPEIAAELTAALDELAESGRLAELDEEHRLRIE